MRKRKEESKAQINKDIMTQILSIITTITTCQIIRITMLVCMEFSLKILKLKALSSLKVTIYHLLRQSVKSCYIKQFIDEVSYVSKLFTRDYQG
jgi:hypothetical protein